MSVFPIGADRGRGTRIPKMDCLYVRKGKGRRKGKGNGRGKEKEQEREKEKKNPQQQQQPSASGQLTPWGGN